jgi:hypothetical protein
MGDAAPPTALKTRAAWLFFGIQKYKNEKYEK